MFDHRKTVGWRVSLFYDTTREATTERIEDLYKKWGVVIKHNAEGLWRDWACQVISHSGGHYCPDGYEPTPDSLNWIFADIETAEKVRDMLVDEMVINVYPHGDITLPASLSRLLNAPVTIEQIKFPDNIISTWLQGYRHPCYSPDITPKRMLEILRHPKSVVASWYFSNNNFGEFWFIDVFHADQMALPKEKRFGPYHMSWYGMGGNEERGTYERGWKHVHTDQWLRQGAVIPQDKASIIAMIEADLKQERPMPKLTARQKLYGLIADITDEDGALAEMEDLEYLGLLDGLLGEDD